MCVWHTRESQPLAVGIVLEAHHQWPFAPWAPTTMRNIMLHRPVQSSAIYTDLTTRNDSIWPTGQLFNHENVSVSQHYPTPPPGILFSTNRDLSEQIHDFPYDSIPALANLAAVLKLNASSY